MILSKKERQWALRFVQNKDTSKLARMYKKRVFQKSKQWRKYKKDFEFDMLLLSYVQIKKVMK